MNNKNDLLELSFLDNAKVIPVNLNKNVVLFGNNGKGKTRILKTINSLYELSKNKNLDDIAELIEEMNLKSLKFNGIAHTQLNSSMDSIKKSEETRILKFIFENKYFLEKLFNTLVDIKVDLSIISTYSFLEQLDEIIKSAGQKHLSKKISVSIFNRWFETLMISSKTLIPIENFSNEEEIKKIRKTQNLMGFLTHRYIESANDYSDKLNNERSNLKRNAKSLIDDLSRKSALYISTENPEIEDVKFYISLTKKQIDEDLQKLFWQGEINRATKINNITQRKNKYIDIQNRFNKIMERYAPITLDLLCEKEFCFRKNKTEIDFTKLSSGERRLVYLFLNIIVHEVDIYLIDEPEASLSLDFQNKIVLDLHRLTSGKLLMIATHAPYIYEDFMSIEGNISQEV